MSEKLNVAACDDDASARGIIGSSLKTVFEQHGTDVNISVYSSADILAAELPVRHFDVIFLDIDMPGIDGISFARQLRAADSATDIIYISNREDKVFEALSTRPDGFIRKSRFLEDMSEVVGNYMKQREKRRAAPASAIVVHTDSGLRNLPLSDIRYVEGSHKQQLIWTVGAGSPYTVTLSMQELEDELGPHGFLRIHKGYLVNYRFIRQIESAEVLLDNGSRIPLSRRKLSEVREQYLKLMQGDGSLIF